MTQLKKRCSKCSEEKPNTKEYFYSNGRGGLRSSCKACDFNYDHTSRPPYEVAKTEEYKAYRRATRKRYPQPNRIRYADPVKETERKRTWRKNNRDKVAIQKRRRAARLSGAPGTFSLADIEIIRKQQKGCCWWCGRPLSQTGEHIDHRVPVSKGGSNYPENICLSCPSCNIKKGAKMHFNGRLL